MTTRSSTFTSQTGLTAADLNALAGTWNSFTPAVTGWTLGNGTVTGRYLQFGYLNLCRIQLAYGTSTATNSTYLGLALPLGAYTGQPILSAYANIGGTRYPLTGYMSSTTMYLQPVATSGSYAAEGTFSASVPGTWAAGDDVYLLTIYEASAL